MRSSRRATSKRHRAPRATPIATRIGARRQRELVARLLGIERRQRAFGVAHELVDPVRAERHAEVLRDDVLELMRLVDDRQIALRNDRAVAALTDRRVRAQQVVIDDDDVGRDRALAHARDEAVDELRTLAAEALLARRGQVVPERQVVRAGLRSPRGRRSRSPRPIR